MKVKVLNLNGQRRCIRGELIDELDIDYTQSLDELKIDLDLALAAWIQVNESKWFSAFKKIPKDIHIHQGSSHLDIVESNVGSLNWLLIQDF